MKVVYFGSDVFLSCFTTIMKKHEVLALYTYHNDEDYFTEYNIVHQAIALGIPVHYEAITPREIIRFFQEEACDLFFLAEYDRLLPIPKNLPSFRAINTHSSRLPQGRSYYPIEAAMQQGLTRTGVTMHKVTQRVDSGDIIDQRTVEITPQMDSIDVYMRCGMLAAEMIEDILADLNAAWARGVPQTERLPYWKRPSDETLTLTHTMTCAQAQECFRCFNSLMQVQLDDVWYYVSALMTGEVSMTQDVWALAADRWLYRVLDGHLRLTVQPMPRREGAQ